MAQSLEVQIKATSDVPQVVDKAKKATEGLSKQIDDIGKKFSTAFKDIALSFIAPVVLLNAAMNYISAAIEKRKQEMNDAVSLADKAESRFISSEQSMLATIAMRKEQLQKEEELAKLAPEASTAKILKSDDAMRERVISSLNDSILYRIGLKSDDPEKMAKREDVQAAVLKDIQNQQKSGELGKLFDNKGTPQSLPQGFSSVVGVGANPVVEAMSAQLEESRKQTELLSKMVNGSPAVNTDFTKTSNPVSLPRTYIP